MFIPQIALALLLIGIGIGSTWPHILTSVLLFASDSEADRASASLTTVQLYSTAVSSALAGIITVFSGITDNPSNVTSSAHVLLGAIILLLVGGIPFAFTVAKKMAIKNRGM